eukprot:1155246-Prorocentrum_minimum.AAC.1
MWGDFLPEGGNVHEVQEGVQAHSGGSRVRPETRQRQHPYGAGAVDQCRRCFRRGPIDGHGRARRFSLWNPLGG